jgi:hypothetical protein
MVRRVIAPLLCLLASGCAAGGSTSGHASLTGKSSAKGKVYLSKMKGGDTSTRLARLRVSPEACEGYDLTPEHKPLDQSRLRAHLDSVGIEYTVQLERDDLHIFRVRVDNQEASLRVATLKSATEAGRHLHEALLEHGKGYWGVHRGNVAVLAPAGSPPDAIGFAQRTGLLCWGVFTQAGRDDNFAIPGAYFEL